MATFLSTLETGCKLPMEIEYDIYNIGVKSEPEQGESASEYRLQSLPWQKLAAGEGACAKAVGLVPGVVRSRAAASTVGE